MTSYFGNYEENHIVLGERPYVSSCTYLAAPLKFRIPFKSKEEGKKMIKLAFFSHENNTKQESRYHNGNASWGWHELHLRQQLSPLRKLWLKMRKRIGTKPAAAWDLIRFLSWLLLLAVFPPLFFKSTYICFFFVRSHSNTAPRPHPILRAQPKMSWSRYREDHGERNNRRSPDTITTAKCRT